VKAAMIVAHPDDESLWGAGFLIEDNWYAEWTVICCSTPAHDPPRAFAFKRACAVLGVKSVMLGAKDREPLLKFDLPSLSEFARVVTHNHVGEYGHAHHKQVHSAVRAAYGGVVFGFGYGIPFGEKSTMGRTLSDASLDKKIEALQCYNHTANTDKSPKWIALVDKYFNGQAGNLRNEDYVVYLR
jgi:hypothetical protein